MEKIFTDIKDLKALDKEFIYFLDRSNKELCLQLKNLRSNANYLEKEYSTFIVKLAPYLDDFIEKIFSIEKENIKLKKELESYNIIFDARRKFVERYALRHYENINLNKEELQDLEISLTRSIGGSSISQKELATKMLEWLTDKTQYTKEIELAAKYSAFMVSIYSPLALFNIPKKIDPENRISDTYIKQLSEKSYIGYEYRDSELGCIGTNKTENISTKTQVQSSYCIYCHQQSKDYCRKGIPEDKRSERDNSQAKNGCPLDQKISEMNLIRSLGYNIGALAIIMIDNPLVALTGHRICNECSKACIFQKQDPVNIPLIETDILNKVLEFPYGVEIYYLLSQWNPLKSQSYLPKRQSLGQDSTDANDGFNHNHNKYCTHNTSKSKYNISRAANILVTGTGPSGCAISYYLLREGHNVLAVDGLKISPIDTDLDIGRPIKHWAELNKSLASRKPQGFGGVAEYGITHRWNKNLLLLIRIILERNNNFKLIGSCKLGSNITIDQAFKNGIDHIALCIGAGRPKYLSGKGYFLKGVKSAADFLMQIGLGASHLKSSNSNLQIRLPAAVYGCGLTAIDSAVEIMHYYSEMVKKFASRFNEATKKNASMADELTTEELSIAQEYISHAKEFNDLEKNDKNLDPVSLSKAKIKLIQKFGGVTLYYRKSIKHSPAYRLNHEEIEQALSIGVKIEDEHEIANIFADDSGSIEKISFTNGAHVKTRTLLLGLGTEVSKFSDLKNHFDAQEEQGTKRQFFKRKDKRISYFGDCNLKYHGSVVKALASAKEGYQDICKNIEESTLRESQLHNLDQKLETNLGELSKKLISKLVSKKRVADKLWEITINSPFACNNIKPGQFFRFQNFASDIKDLTEPLALTPVNWNKETGDIIFLVLERGKSSSLVKSISEGEEIALMGPSGKASYIPRNRKIALIASGLGKAMMRPIAQAMKDKNCHITIVNIGKTINDVGQGLDDSSASDDSASEGSVNESSVNEGSASDESASNHSSKLTESYLESEDEHSIENYNTRIIENLENHNAEINKYTSLEDAHNAGALFDAEYIYILASDKISQNITATRDKYFNPGAELISAFNVPMQCLMKGICGQCVVRVIRPDGEEDYDFACSNQDYPSSSMDYRSLRQRHSQNSLLEKLR